MADELWIGVTLTSQEDAARRLPLLMRGGCGLRRFAVVSAAIDLTCVMTGSAGQFSHNALSGRVEGMEGHYGRLDLVIGPPSIRAACEAAGVAFEEASL